MSVDCRIQQTVVIEFCKKRIHVRYRGMESYYSLLATSGFTPCLFDDHQANGVLVVQHKYRLFLPSTVGGFLSFVVSALGYKL